MALPPLAHLILLGLQGLGLLPAVDGIVDADGADADAEQVHGQGLVALALGLGLAHEALAHLLLARLVRLGGLVDVIGGGDGRDGGQASVQQLLVARLLHALRLVLGGEGGVFVDGVRDGLARRDARGASSGGVSAVGGARGNVGAMPGGIAPAAAAAGAVGIDGLRPFFVADHFSIAAATGGARALRGDGGAAALVFVRALAIVDGRKVGRRLFSAVGRFAVTALDVDFLVHVAVVAVSSRHFARWMWLQRNVCRLYEMYESMWSENSKGDCGPY